MLRRFIRCIISKLNDDDLLSVVSTFFQNARYEINFLIINVVLFDKADNTLNYYDDLF